jgi:hypothetical protein
MEHRCWSVALLLVLACGGSDDDGSPSSDAAASAADAAHAVADAAELDAAAAVAGPSLAVTTMVPESVPRGSGSHTYVLPQLSETADTVAGGAAGAVDTVIRAIYDSGQAGLPAGAGAEMDLFLIDRDSGTALLASGGGSVCDPCIFNLGSTNRTVSASIATLVEAAGGFAGPVDAVALIVVSGADPDGVSLEATTRRLAPNPLSMSQTPLQPHAGVDDAFVVPHYTETAGDPLTDPGASDLTVHVLYTGGLGTVPDGGGAELDLYLFDDGGDPLAGQDTTAVCDPCVVNVSAIASDRAVRLRIESLMGAHGGLAAPEVDYYGVAILGGADPSGAVVWATRAE